MGRPLGFDVQIRHADPRTLLGLGGSKAKTEKSENFSFGRAKHDAPPKVKSQNKYKNDHLLTRSGKRGALVLGRMARVLAPKPPKVEPPQSRSPAAAHRASGGFGRAATTAEAGRPGR
jgi:hypothetical protein